MGGSMPRPIALMTIVLLAACGEDLVEPTTAVLELRTVTTGAPVDPDGYAVRIDGGQPTAIGANVTLSIPDLIAGEHSVELVGLAGNCVLAGENPRTVTANAGGVARTRFEVACSPPSGTIRVVTTTRGARPDPDGYVVLVNNTEHAVGTNTSLTVPGLPVGEIVVELTGVAENCVVGGGETQTISLTNGTTFV